MRPHPSVHPWFRLDVCGVHRAQVGQDSGNVPNRTGDPRIPGSLSLRTITYAEVGWSRGLSMATTTAVDSAQCDTTYEFTPADILTPSAFPHRVTRFQVCETNISWVILTGTIAYKIKKSVQLDFIDTSTLAQRRHLCEEELRLNRRLAADLYLDVVAITRGADGVRVAGHGPIVEYAVRMKQFEATQDQANLTALALGDRDRLVEPPTCLKGAERC